MHIYIPVFWMMELVVSKNIWRTQKTIIPKATIFLIEDSFFVLFCFIFSATRINVHTTKQLHPHLMIIRYGMTWRHWNENDWQKQRHNSSFVSCRVVLQLNSLCIIYQTNDWSNVTKQDDGWYVMSVGTDVVDIYYEKWGWNMHRKTTASNKKTYEYMSEVGTVVITIMINCQQLDHQIQYIS